MERKNKKRRKIGLWIALLVLNQLLIPILQYYAQEKYKSCIFIMFLPLNYIIIRGILLGINEKISKNLKK